MPSPTPPAAAAPTAAHAEAKVVLCVVASLGMSAGKVAAQAAHAAVGLFRRMQDERPPWLSAWEHCGEKTVVLSVPTAAEAEALATKALSTPRERKRAAYDAPARCAVHAVLNAGRTEVAPGSFTVLGLGGARGKRWLERASCRRTCTLLTGCAALHRACSAGGQRDGAPAHAALSRDAARWRRRYALAAERTQQICR